MPPYPRSDAPRRRIRPAWEANRKRTAACALLTAGGFLLLAGVAAAQLGGAVPPPLPLLPPDNWWNLDVSRAPVDPGSAGFVAFVGAGTSLHPDFGGDDTSTSYGVFGFPYAVVPGSQPLEPVTFVLYGNESDPGAPGRPRGYPIPAAARNQAKWIEGGFPGGCTNGDCHMLLIDRDHRLLFEIYQAHWSADHWEAGSGAVFSLDSNARRPEGWTSADAAGLAIFPGLVRYDEIFGPEPIRHAFRFTARDSNGHVVPASHDAGSATGALPMGARLRLKAGKDLSGYPSYVQKIFQAMKTYGLILADNGTNLYIQGTYDTRWDNDILNPAFASLSASDFEVVKLGWAGPIASAPCAAAGTRLCLASARFAVDVQYILPDSTSGPGRTIPLTTDTGAFWFFASSNLEMLLKVLDGCNLDNHFWIFAAGLTNTQVVITVTDTATGRARRYLNPQGTAFAPIQDTTAFACH